MFPLTITIHNKSQLDAVMAALSVEPAPAAPAKPAAAKPTAEKPAPKAEPEKQAAPAEAKAERTVDEARRLVVALGAVKRKETVDLLAEYNAKTATQVPADKVNEFVTRIEKLAADLGVTDLTDRASKVKLS